MARHSRENREDETVEMPLTVSEVSLDVPEVELVMAAPDEGDVYVRSTHEPGPFSPSDVAESGPFSLKGGTDDYQPMYRGGPWRDWGTDEPRKPAAAEPNDPWRVGELAAEIEGVRHRRGTFILALIGVTLSLVAATLAVWVYLHGCNCPVVPSATLTPIAPTPPPPPGP